MKTKPNQTTVLITGASNGIGFATAKRFAQEGYIVIATARSVEQRSNLLALAKQYPNVILRELDVTDKEENIKNLVNSLGKIDVLINNAGIGIVGVAESFSQTQIQHIINTNVFGVVNVTNAVLPLMRKHNSGMIITLSSIVGPLPDMKQCFYSGSKAMIEHYTAQLKNDLKQAGYDIEVANVHPGPVDTNFAASAKEGNRFEKQENPYQQMDTDITQWRSLMREGRPVSETVDTIFKVVNDKHPAFWNPTEQRVYNNFSETYKDPSGARFAQGPSFAPTPHKIPLKLTIWGEENTITDLIENMEMSNIQSKL